MHYCGTTGQRVNNLRAEQNGLHLQTTFLNVFSWMNVIAFWFKFHCKFVPKGPIALLWRHNGHDVVSNHQPNDCLLIRSFRRRSRKMPKLRVTGLCVGNSPETGEFPTQMASNAENVSIWWRHHRQTVSQHWFTYRHQAFTWTNVDQDVWNMALLGHRYRWIVAISSHNSADLKYDRFSFLLGYCRLKPSPGMCLLFTCCVVSISVNTLWLNKNGCHVADYALWFMFFNKNIFSFWWKFLWNLFLRFRLTINQHWFR